MARQEITVAGRIEMMRHAVIARARNIATYLDTLAGLEKHIPKGPELEVFRLSVQSIRADVDSLANEEERNAE